MNKFKVGDKVRVKKDLKAGKNYGGLTFCFGHMQTTRGYESTIVEVYHHSDRSTTYRIKGQEYYYSEKMLEAAKDVTSPKFEMNKFKVGDKVRILDGSKIKDYTGGWCMNDQIGMIATINDISYYSDGKVSYWMEEFSQQYDERGLELVTPEAIVIYRNGNEVIALDKTTGKKAVAKCSPKDEFNFEIGAKLAFERLFSDLHVFKVGDRIIGTKEANRYLYTHEGWEGIVTKVYCDGEIDAKDLNDGGVYTELEPRCFVLANSIKAKPKYFNGKVVCVEAKTFFFTKGKIYEIKDGVGFDDAGDIMTSKPIASIEELNDRMDSQFMEIVE